MESPLLDSLELAPPGFDPEAPPPVAADLDHLELPASPVACDLSWLERDPLSTPLSPSRLDALSLAPPGFESPSLARTLPAKAA